MRQCGSFGRSGRCSSPSTGKGRGPRVVHERLRYDTEPDLVAQAIDGSRKEPSAKREVSRLLGGDSNVHRRDRIGYLVQPDTRHVAHHRRTSLLGIGQGRDRQHSRIAGGHRKSFCCLDEVPARRRPGSRPPGAVRNGHQRA